MRSFPRIELPDFEPHPLLGDPHLMSLVGALPRLGSTSLVAGQRKRLFPVERGTQVLALANRHDLIDPRPVVLIVHGLLGSAESEYVVGTASKLFDAGFDVVRLNVRNCGGTESLATTSYHGGMTADALAVATQLADWEGHEQVFLVGFSLGGNMVLKLAGELGPAAPAWLRGVVAVSPCVDFEASASALDASPLNRLAQRRFITGLQEIARRKHELDPARFPIDGMERARTLREFDDLVTSRFCGFRDASDYYARGSSLPWVPKIEVPTLMITARDDPLIPFESFESDEVRENPLVRLVATERGGHVAFLGRSPARNAEWTDVDRRWAENRVVQTCSVLAGADRLSPCEPRPHSSSS